MTRSTARRVVLLVTAGIAIAALAAPAAAQGGPAIAANPNHGPPTSTFTLTFNNYQDCDPSTDVAVPCITIDFIQGPRVTTLGTADSNGAATFAGTLQVPPACTATRTTQCSVVGPAIIRAHSSKGDDASTGFTVDAPGAATTTTTAPPTTTTTSTTSTTVAPTTTTSSTSTSSSTTSSTEVSTTETTERALGPTKKSSSNDDV